jgi:ParB family chromosome partitioning protein
MTRKRPGLGKGLDALIPKGTGFQPEESSSGLRTVQISNILPNPRQPRKNFDSDELSELTDSIKEHGIIQPLIVSQGLSAGEFILIAGERRLIAAKEAGLTAVDVIIRDANEQDRLELALIENIQRTDLGPLEKAEAYKQLCEDFNLPHEEIGKRVGKSRVAVTNTLRLLSLPKKVQDAISSEQISEGHARALLSLKSSQSQIAALKTIVERELSVRETENLVRKLLGARKTPKGKLPTSPEIKEMEEKLQSRLGTKVILDHGKNRGKITIYYYSDEELNSLLNTFFNEG